jgi:Asp-tRNA(Asn)/Glu-tRNA(Gln) amidotransferase A subunit family amidase
MELTIVRAHEAMLAGTLTAHDLVQAYLARIDAYDKRGPTLNALLRVNPRALARADSLDAELAHTGRLTGPLHGIPFIVKDNYDTHDMPTTAGSAALADSRPADDASLVRRIREAGAIVLAKSNMAEFAFSAFETIGSAMPGHTFNPYALNRVPAGSSGGTAAAVAANFAMVGLGTDTGNSVRGPASHTALVGIRATQGLASRDGIVPLSATRDMGGPLARTVEDAVRVLDVIAGTDPADSVTAEADRHRPDSYLGALRTGLDGVRIGVVGTLARTPTADPEVMARFGEALTHLRELGAELVDPVEVPELEILRQGLFCPRFRHDLERYLATLPNPPVRTLAEIEASGLVHSTAIGRIRRILVDERSSPDEDPRCVAAAANEERLRAAVRAAMRRHAVVALVYPTWSNPPRLIGDLDSPHGNNSEALAPPTGFPAITVPMGFVGTAELPTGLQIMGDAWDEATILGIAHAYEQATLHRRPPATTPPLGGG